MSGPVSGFPAERRQLAEARAPWRGSIELGDGLYRIEATAPGFQCLSDPVDIRPGRSQPLLCKLKPAGLVSGELALSRDEVWQIEGFQVAYQPSARRSDHKASPDSIDETTNSVYCDAHKKLFECGVPVGELDLRIDIPGFKPVFFWAKTISSNEGVSLGKVNVERGVTLEGWITGDDASAVPRAVVELRPASAARFSSGAEEGALSLHQAETRVDPRGRFEFSGVSPGQYIASIRAEGYCTSETQISIPTDKPRVSFPRALVLERCAELEVFIEPPLSFDGQPWSLHLIERPIDSRAGRRRNEAAGLDGAVSIMALEPGQYDLEIADSTGDVWWKDRRDIHHGMAPVFIPIDSVAVRGTVSRGSEPISGGLVFGTRNRKPSISVRVEEGSFEGRLPFEGLWLLELERGDQRQFLDSVEIELRPGKSVVDLDLSIPDTELSGSVVDGGEPVAEALVTLLRSGQRLEKELFGKTDADGEFSFVGLRPGELQIRAAVGRQTSEWFFLKLAEKGKIKDLEIELAARTMVPGRVTVGGVGVPGSRIVAFPQSLEGRTLPTGAVSRADGSFEIKVSKGTQRLDVLIVVPGFETTMAVAMPRSQEGDWPPIEMDTDGQTGTLVLVTDDPELDGSVSFAGAVMTLRDFLSLMTQEDRVNQEPSDGISFHGLAAGPWTFCRAPQRGGCRSVDLFPGQTISVEMIGEELE